MLDAGLVGGRGIGLRGGVRGVGRGPDGAGQGHPKWCLDSTLAWDQYVDTGDIGAWDALMAASPPPLNYCEPPVAGGATGTPIGNLPTGSPLDW